MNAQELLNALQAHGIFLSIKGERLRFQPRNAMTPSLLDGIRKHKAALMEWHAQRLQAYEDAVERCNAAYYGTPIPFDELDAVADRILNSATWAELDAAVEEYEAAAIPELINQPTGLETL